MLKKESQPGLMSAPEVLFFVCVNERPSGVEACGGTHQANTLLKELRDVLKSRGLRVGVRATKSGCLGLCKNGPHALLTPSLEWFSGFSLGDLPALADRIEKEIHDKHST